MEQVSEIDPSIWQLADYGAGPRYWPTSRLLRALTLGRGGLRVAANGIDFPSVILRAAAPSRISIQRSITAFRDGIVPEEISQLQLRQSEHAVLALVLLDEGGVHTCGSLPLEVTSSDPSTVSAIAVESIGALIPGLHANGPVTVRAGGSAGSATLQFKVSGLSTDLPVQVVQ